jgi:hypothetical protein
VYLRSEFRDSFVSVSLALWVTFCSQYGKLNRVIYEYKFHLITNAAETALKINNVYGKATVKEKRFGSVSNVFW